MEQKINYKLKGEGQVIVLLHGFLESSAIWMEYCKHLSKTYEVICMDLPGHGQTPVMSDIHSMELMADYVQSVLHSLNINSCVMIGHSMGGYVTLAFADKYPEMINGIGLFHSHAGADSEEAKINRDRTTELIKNDRTGFIQLFIPDLFASENQQKFQFEIDILKKQAADTTKEGIIAALQGMKERPDRTNVLENASFPILYILGQQDKRIPVDIAISQAMKAKRSEVQLLQNVGHMGYIEDKDYCLKVISGFAEKCSQKP
jgi:pimeloyl-ACP methyl ester carboxylesterase